MAAAEKALATSIVALRAAALALTLTGNSRGGEALRVLASAVESGVAIDEHMASVAEKLATGTITDADWEDVLSRVRAASDKLQAAKPS